jgi:hypothetical protein
MSSIMLKVRQNCSPLSFTGTTKLKGVCTTKSASITTTVYELLVLVEYTHTLSCNCLLGSDSECTLNLSLVVHPGAPGPLAMISYLSWPTRLMLYAKTEGRTHVQILTEIVIASN